MSADPGALTIHRVEAGDAAARTVARIREHLDAGAPPAAIAVLARVTSALLPVQVALTESGIGHTAPLEAAVLKRTGIRTALAYLRLGLDLERIRRDDLLETLNRPARKVKSAVLPLLPRGRLTLRSLEQVADVLGETHRERFTDYLDDLRALEAAITAGADTQACLTLIRRRIGLGEAVDALDASRSRPEGSSHGDDLDALEQLAHLQPRPDELESWLTDRLRVPADPAGVTLATVHKVKGRQWPHVVVVGASAGLFPHRLADDVEEERRVFHVAITRCQASVDVITESGRVSPFVDELAPAAADDGANGGGPVPLDDGTDGGGPVPPGDGTSGDGPMPSDVGTSPTVSSPLAGSSTAFPSQDTVDEPVAHAPARFHAATPTAVTSVPSAWN
ncbi:MAG: 3'-5' exonuclease, partial [Nitriliruptoraceae bacterium]